jgi:hypothetical protein
MIGSSIAHYKVTAKLGAVGLVFSLSTKTRALARN